MKFMIVDPVDQIVFAVDAAELHETYKDAGLEGNKVDHGQITKELAIVVNEYALFMPSEEQCYFSMNGKLFAGTCVLYGVGEAGETVDVSDIPVVTFYKDKEAVEIAMAEGSLIRPVIAINNEVLWEWPQSKPAGYP